MFDKRSIVKNTSPAFRWVKEWVNQDLIASSGRLQLKKWVRDDRLKALKEKIDTPEPEPEPEPTTEVLFLCSYDGCGKYFIDVGSLKKHAHIHGEKQHVCTYQGCGKKFLDSSKLKRHHLIHTGTKDFVCPHEGCGRAFSLDFNMKSHMKTHSEANYHTCPYGDCGKRFAHDYKLQAHIKAHHEKSAVVSSAKHTPSEKSGAKDCGSAKTNRPFVCPYKGCGKSYIHGYKLNLHLKTAHPDDHIEEESGRRSSGMMDHDVDESSDRDGCARKKCKCPYEGCGQSYLHEYKLNLHLKKKHPGHNIIDENGMGGGEHDGFTCPYEECGGKSYMQFYKLNLHMKKEHPDHEMMMEGKNSVGKNLKRSRPSSSRKTEAPASKQAALGTMKSQWGGGGGDARDMFEEGEEDSEETEEEDRENMEDDGWMYHETNEDDEETEDED